MPQPRIARCDHPSKSAASFVGVHGGVPMGMLRLTRVRMQGIYTMSEVAMATLRAKIRGQQYGITPPPDHFGMPNVYRSRTTDRTEAVFASPRADALRLAARCSMLTGVGSPQDGAATRHHAGAQGRAGFRRRPSRWPARVAQAPWPVRR